MRATEHEAVGRGGFFKQRLKVAGNHALDDGAVEPAFFGQRHEQGADEAADLRVGAAAEDGLGVGPAADGGLGGDDRDVAGGRGFAGCARAGLDHADDGHVGPCLAQGRERRRRGGIAGDDQQLDALPDELGGGLKGIADNRFLAFGPVGHAGGVPEEKIVLAGHEAAHGVKDGQAAHAGVEKADGQLRRGFVVGHPAVFRSHLHVLCSIPPCRTERPRPGLPPSAISFLWRQPLAFERDCRIAAAVRVLIHDPALAGRDGREQAAEDAFQQDAFTRGQALPERGPDAEGDELDGAIQRDGQAVALNEAAGEHAGEGVARAGVVGGDVCAVDAPETVFVALVRDDGGILSGIPAAFLQRDACDDHGFRAHRGQAAQTPLRLFGRNPGRERLVEEQGGLSDVRRDDVGAGDEPAHFFHHFRGHGGIEDAVVPKNGVHDRQPAGSKAVADAPGHGIHLFRGGHEP